MEQRHGAFPHRAASERARLALARARDMRYSCVPHVLCLPSTHVCSTCCNAPNMLRSLSSPPQRERRNGRRFASEQPSAAAHSAACEGQRVASPAPAADDAIGRGCAAAAAAATGAVWGRIRHGLVAGLPARRVSPLRPPGAALRHVTLKLTCRCPSLSIWLIQSRMPGRARVSRHLALALCLWLAPRRAAGLSAGWAARAAAWSFCGSSGHVSDISPGTRLADSDPAGIGCSSLSVDCGGLSCCWLTS